MEEFEKPPGSGDFCEHESIDFPVPTGKFHGNLFNFMPAYIISREDLVHIKSFPYF